MSLAISQRALLLYGAPGGERALTAGSCFDAVVAVPTGRSSDVDWRDQLEKAAARHVVVLLAPQPPGDSNAPWLEETEEILAELSEAMVILLSSIEVYGPDHHSTGPTREASRRRSAISNARAEFWEAMEAGLQKRVAAERLLILRIAQVIGGGMAGWLGALLQRKCVVTVFGFDPAIQLIGEDELVKAVQLAVEKRLTGTFNLAPADALPLRRILSAVGVRSIPLPWSLLSLVHRGPDRLAYMRYPCQGAGDLFAAHSGLKFSTVRALRQVGGRGTASDLSDYADPHGADRPYVGRIGRGRLKFLEEVYWRIERRGFEHIPREGPAILVGPHRGFMPLDAVMMVDLVNKNAGRLPRFLLHPTLVKFPFLAPFMRRLGGVAACKPNAREALESGQLLGIYPEGIRGAFKLYRDAYRLGRFGRPDYAKLALEQGVPVIPFATLGCAEIFPILARFRWRWVKRYLEWPFLPITPTFPLAPIPLPSKWHIQVLPPIDPEPVVAEAERRGEEPYMVMVEKVKASIETATTEMLQRRRSVFWGEVFEKE